MQEGSVLDRLLAGASRLREVPTVYKALVPVFIVVGVLGYYNLLNRDEISDVVSEHEAKQPKEIASLVEKPTQGSYKIKQKAPAKEEAKKTMGPRELQQLYMDEQKKLEQPSEQLEEKVEPYIVLPEPRTEVQRKLLEEYPGTKLTLKDEKIYIPLPGDTLWGFADDYYRPPTKQLVAIEVNRIVDLNPEYLKLQKDTMSIDAQGNLRKKADGIRGDEMDAYRPIRH